MGIKQFCVVRKICVIVFCAVQVDDRRVFLPGDSGCRLSSFVAVPGHLLAVFLIFLDQTVHMSFGNAKRQGSSVLIAIFVHQPLDHLIFSLFIHCKIHLSDNIASLLWRIFYHTLGHFHLWSTETLS